MAGLPRHTADLQWEPLYDVLFLDLDILNLFNAELDGIEDPESGPNKKIDMGDYRPQAWFTTFHSSDTRDPRRPFRR